MLLLAGAVLLSAAAVYSPALTFGLITDDRPLLAAIPHWTFAAIPQFFAHHYWAFINNSAGVIAAYYRPLLLVYDFVVYRSFGALAPAWHAMAILLHVAVTFLVYRMALALSGDDTVALSSTALFALDPVHAEAVARASGVSESLTAALVLASFLCWLRRSSGRVYSIGALAFFCLALLTKETAIMFPAVLLVFELLSRRSWSAVRSVWLFIAVSLTYLIVRRAVLGGIMNTLMQVPARVMLLTWPSMAIFYTRHLVWPVPMSYKYPLGLQTAITGKVILGMVVLAGLMVLAYRIQPFATCWAVLFLLPVFNLQGMTDLGIVHDRYLYLPSVGFCIVVGTAFRPLYAAHRRLAIAGGSALLILLGCMTVAECRPWREEAPLFKRALELNPDDPVMTRSLVVALIRAGECPEAEPVAEQALQKRDDASLRVSLAGCYLGESRLVEARYQLERAIAAEPGLSTAQLLLAWVHVAEHQFSDAETELNAIAQAHGTEQPGFHLLRGRVLESRGDWPGAAAEFRKELTVNPSSEVAQSELEKAEWQSRQRP